jgi:hypothetical protein
MNAWIERMVCRWIHGGHVFDRNGECYWCTGKYKEIR